MTSILRQKGVGMRDLVAACFEMSLMGMWKKLNIFIKVS